MSLLWGPLAGVARLGRWPACTHAPVLSSWDGGLHGAPVCPPTQPANLRTHMTRPPSPRPAGAKEGFFSSLVDCVVDQMGDTYPELVKHRDNIRCAGRGPRRKRPGARAGNSGARCHAPAPALGSPCFSVRLAPPACSAIIADEEATFSRTLVKGLAEVGGGGARRGGRASRGRLGHDPAMAVPLLPAVRVPAAGAPRGTLLACCSLT